MTRLTAQARRVAMASITLAAFAVPTDAASATAPTPSSFADLLAMAPASALATDGVTVTYTDMSLAWERIGAGDDDASRMDALGDLAVHETFTLTPQVFGARSMLVDEARAEVGFSLLDIERELAIMAPPHHFYIDVTTVSPDAIDAAIESDPVWSERLTRVDSEHGSYVDWGDGSEVDPTAVSPLRPLGQAGQLAILGDPATTVRTLDAGDIEAVLTTAAGAGEPLTLTPVVGPVAEVLGDDVVLQAMIQPGPNPFQPPLGASVEQIEAIMEQAVLVLPYLGVAVVEVVVGDSTRTEALLVHRDEASAEANVELVETVLADGIDLTTQVPLAEMLPDPTVIVDGVVVRVDVSGAGSFRRLVQLLQTRALFPSA